MCAVSGVVPAASTIRGAPARSECGFFIAVRREAVRKEVRDQNFTIHLISRGSKKQLGKGVSAIPQKVMSR
jgi:hypothetical protein